MNARVLLNTEQHQLLFQPLDALEQAVYETERVHGALRAVSCLVQPWRHDETGLDVENLKRNDLAQLLSLMADELGTRIKTLETKVGAVNAMLPNPAAKAKPGVAGGNQTPNSPKDGCNRL